MTDETLDPVILEPADDGSWTHRYGPAPEGYGYRGKTVCCERVAYAPLNTMSYAVDSVLIDDCCATPGVHKPVVLPPYSGEHATCRKCGSRSTETKYTRRTESPYGVGPMGYPKEWLARRCTVCQATWDEATVPAAETGSSADRYLAAIDRALSRLDEVGVIAAGVPAEGVAARVNAARDILCAAACASGLDAPQVEPMAVRHRLDHHGEPRIMQLGCPLCADEMSVQFDIPADAVMRSMLNVRGGGDSRDG